MMRGSFVFAVARDSARQIRVNGGGAGDRTEIVSGLEDSLQVISVGQQFVKDRGPVTIQR